MSQVIAALATPLLIGLVLVRAILPRDAPRGLAVVTAWCAGSLFLALTMWSLAWADALDWAKTVGLSMAAAAGIGLCVIRARARGAPCLHAAVVPRKPSGVVFAAVVAFASAVLLVAYASQFSEPVLRGDEAGIWAASAKLAFAARGFGAGYVESGQESIPAFMRLMTHQDYPPLHPMLQLWVFEVAGKIVHFENRFIANAFGLCWLTLLASAVRRRASSMIAVPVFLLGFAQPHVHDSFVHGMSDGIVTLAVGGAIDSWLSWYETRETGYWRGLCTFIAVVAWTKHEGLMLGSVLLVVLVGGAIVVRAPRAVLFASGSAATVAWCLIPIGLAAATFVGNQRLGLSNDLFGSGVPAVPGGVGGTVIDGARAVTFERVASVARVIATGVFGDFSGTCGVFLVSFVMVAATLIRNSRARSYLSPPALALATMFLGYAVVFVVTPAPLAWHWGTAGSRVFSHLTAGAVVLLAGLWSPWPRRSARAVD